MELNEQFKKAKSEFSLEMEQNIISNLLGDLAKELWENMGDSPAIEKIEFHPIDALGGSVCIYLNSMPGFFLRLWYAPKENIYWIAIFRHLSGNLGELIPNTFSDSGLVKVKDLDQFTEHFVNIIAKEEYNMIHKKVFK